MTASLSKLRLAYLLQDMQLLGILRRCIPVQMLDSGYLPS